MARRCYILFLLLPCALLLAAALPAEEKREKDKDKDGWLPITPEELALKDNPAEPGSHAMILYREMHTDDPKAFVTQYYRIKIFTDEGKKHADVTIPYLEKVTQIEDLRARTIRPDGTVVPFRGRVFEKTVVKTKRLKFQAKTFTLPEVATGSIIEYAYRIERPKAPDVLRNPWVYRITGAFSIPTIPWVIQEELFTRRARFSLRPFPGMLGCAVLGLPRDRQPSRTHDGIWQLEFDNILRFEEEDHMPPEDVLKSRVDCYYLMGSVSSPGSFWHEYGKQGAERVEKFIGKSKAIEREVSRLVRPDDPPEAKLRKLYTRAQQIRYLSYERDKTEKEEQREKRKQNESVEDVLKRGYAAANEINYLFAALARAAGFEAWVVAAAGRDRTFFRDDLLDASQLNAKVVLVRVGSEDRYFDPATRFCPFDLLPWEETGTVGIRLDSNRATSLKIPPPKITDTLIERKAELELAEDGGVHGKFRLAFTGQEALRRRIDAGEDDEATRRKDLEDEVKGWLPAGATIKLESVTGWEVSEEPLRAELTVEIPNLGVAAGRRLLLPLGIFQVNRRPVFQHAKRVHPIYFRYPYQEVDELSVRLPAGFQIESLPEPQNTVPSGSQFTRYQIAGKHDGGTLRIERRFTLGGIFFPADYYPTLRQFFSRVKAGDEQQAVLEATQAAARD